MSREAGARLRPQPNLERCERTSDPKPGLSRNNRDCRQVQEPQPKRIDPAPAVEISDNNEDQAAYNEEHYREVQRQNRVGQKLKFCGVGHATR